MVDQQGVFHVKLRVEYMIYWDFVLISIWDDCLIPIDRSGSPCLDRNVDSGNGCTCVVRCD